MKIRIGIFARKSVPVIFHGDFKCTIEDVPNDYAITTGQHNLSVPALYEPLSEDAYFELKDVTIGNQFHWERKETQAFKGALECESNPNGGLIAINIIDLEDYLSSVIASEMSGTSMPELLKAHAIISRSWVLNKMQQARHKNNWGKDQLAATCTDTAEKHLAWYGSEPHIYFDVCADDHCQRYQGITRTISPQVLEAIESTRGRVLASEGELCDARFYKACGGITEAFENCWEDEPKSYLTRVVDAEAAMPLTAKGKKPAKKAREEAVRWDLTQEDQARKWILSSPAAFCNTTDQAILTQVLNDYDQETPDFYRWKVVYSAEELSAIVRERSGIDFGEILDLIPVKRGTSGRLVELKIVGSKRTLIVGKELEIRKWLSKSHLYSSAFVVDRAENGDFILNGAGWGHGVGLCQIGAAVMASKGYTYDQILEHYYPGTEILPYEKVL